MPAGAIERVAADLGLKLLPWQREVAERLMRGESLHIVIGRKAGRSELRRLLDRLAADSALSEEVPDA